MFRHTSHGVQVLLAHENNHLWGFPGGDRKPIDKNAVRCALREFREETGVAINFADVTSVQEYAHYHSVVVYVDVTALPAYAAALHKKKVNTQEVIETRFVNFSEMWNGSSNRGNRSFTLHDGTPIDMRKFMWTKWMRDCYHESCAIMVATQTQAKAQTQTKIWHVQAPACVAQAPAQVQGVNATSWSYGK